jgi:hypothetical protein
VSPRPPHLGPVWFRFYGTQFSDKQDFLKS